MARKGKDKVPKIDPALLASDKAFVRQQLTLDERDALAQLAPETAFVMGTAPTTLCTEHVRSDENPDECAKCGKPLTPPITDEMLRQAEEDLKRFDAAAAEARQSDLRFDDGPRYDEPEVTVSTSAAPPPVEPPKVLCAWCGLEVTPMWMDRAFTMAKAQGVGVTEFMTTLIKRQWIASGAGKGKP
jgi:hypothetical protein